jgi:hypothetical protein
MQEPKTHAEGEANREPAKREAGKKNRVRAACVESRYPLAFVHQMME